MILSRADIASMLARLQEFEAKNPDYASDQRPTICPHCLDVGIGRWVCYCQADD